MNKNFCFAKRTNWQLNSNQLAQKREAIEKEGGVVLDLTESNPTQCQFNYPKEELLTPLSMDRNLYYSPCAQGIDEARQAVTNYYQNNGFKIDSRQIFLTCSTSEAYSSLFRLLVNPGEEILVPQPSYPLFEFLIELSDARIQAYPLIYDGHRWQIDFELLKEAISNKTRVIILVNPNNPTGSFLKKRDIENINRLCEGKNIALISDEVFFDYQHSIPVDEAAASLLENKNTLSFTLGGLSKSLGLPQMKVSWIVVNGPDDLVQEAGGRLEIILDTYLSVTTPSQNALPQWLSLNSLIQQEIKKRLHENGQFLEQNTCPLCTCLPAEGGWYIILKLPKTLSEEEWVVRFLEEDGVYVHPGYFFDFADEPYAVLSLLTFPGVFQEGVRRIIKRVEAVHTIGIKEG